MMVPYVSCVVEWQQLVWRRRRWGVLFSDLALTLGSLGAASWAWDTRRMVGVWVSCFQNVHIVAPYNSQKLDCRVLNDIY